MTFLSGLLLGLGMILPIGAQNMLVLNQGIVVGLPRSLFAVLFAGLCDTVLIVVGAAGVSGLLNSVPGLRPALLAFGVCFLVYLAVDAFRQSSAPPGADVEPTRVRDIAVRCMGVSLLNPHAILDTVGVIGAAVAAQPLAHRAEFAFGAVSASWLWFVVLVVAAGMLRKVMTGGGMVWLNRISGAVMALFACILLTEFIATFS